MDGKDRRLIKEMENVVQELDSYCITDCANTWACKGCGIHKAKIQITLTQSTLLLPSLGEELEPDDRQAIEKPCRHLTVMPGGKVH